MSLDRSFIERNRASTERIRVLVARLNDAELSQPLGEHWTVAVALAHLAFWDRRVLHLLDQTEQAGKLVAPAIDLAVNDISLPLWAAMPPREAARLAIETAAALDQRLEAFPPALLEQIGTKDDWWLVRARHRDLHLDEVEAALPPTKSSI
jgi:hypothetical protein